MFDDGKCVVEGKPRDFFFPKGERTGMSKKGLNQAEAEQVAEQYCNGCKRQIECAKYAIDNEISDGVWGFVYEKRREVQVRLKRKIKVA